MYIIFNKKVLLDNLQPLMGTVSTKNTITTIEGVLIETLGENTVRFSSYDMTKGIRVTLEALEVVEGGSFILNAQRLMQIVRLLGGDEITIKIDAQYNGTVSSEKSSFSMYALRGEDFPALPELTGKRGFTISAAVLRDKIARVIHSVAETDNRPMLCGVYFQIKENHLKIVSCDGYTLSICRIKCDIRDIGEESATEFKFILPGNSLNELIKLLSDRDGEIRILLARKHAIILMDRLLFFTRMIDSEYMDYEKVMPKEQPITLFIDRERFLAGLERVNLVADEKIQGANKSYVKLNIEGNMIYMTSASVNGRVHDEMPCEHEGDDLVVGFNCRWLINNVRAATGDTIKMTFKSSTQSMTIEPIDENEDNDFYYMLVPVRMTEWE